MRIAIKRDATIVDDKGHVSGKDTGATLLRRLLRLFPEAVLIGPEPFHSDTLDIVPLEFLDPADTVIINMDVMDSPALWNRLRDGGQSPASVMNFLWWPTTLLDDIREISTVALSCALFPTFAGSRRHAEEVRDLVEQWTVAEIAESLRLEWVNPGFRLAHVQERHDPRIPIVMYPSIVLSARKRPQDFIEVIDTARTLAPDVDFRVEMRLHEAHLESDVARSIATRDWVSIESLLTDRTDYWAALSRTTAFVATSPEEAYGLGCVEALGAGAIGIFPDVPWAQDLLPEGYPYLWSDLDEAADMLIEVLEDPASARAQLNALTGGDFIAWVNADHSDLAFERALTGAVAQWFGQ